MSRNPQGLEELYHWRDDIRRTHDDGEIIRAIGERLKNEKDAPRFTLLRLMLAQEYESQGYYAAADNIYRSNAIDEVWRWYEDVTGEGIDIIQTLKERVEGEPDGAKQRELKELLAHHYGDVGKYAASEAIHLQLFEAYPLDPLPAIKLAEQKLYLEDQPALAMRAIDRAVEAAYRSGGFRRQALTMKARIASWMKDYRTVEDTLVRIMQLEFEPGNIDAGYIRDFFDRLPPGSIDPEVARRYDAYVRAGQVDWEQSVKASFGVGAKFGPSAK